MRPYWSSPDGRAVLFHGDCLEVLPTHTGIDAVVTDPPYGLNWQGSRGSTLEWQGFANDDGSLNLRPILTMRCTVVAFGANRYPDQLPSRGRWICWDKRVNPKCDAMFGTPFELAWVNATHGKDRFYRIMHGGAINADGPGRRQHPTQKPISLMAAILEDYTHSDWLVADPFTGSGTTGVACIKTGRRFVGIEIEERYCEIAARRMEQAASHLFAQAVSP